MPTTEPDGGVAANIVHSQVAAHAPYGGVVPEIASREHLAKVSEDLAEAPQPTSTGSIVLYSMIGCIVLVAIGFGLASLRRNLQAKKRRERRAAARQEASYGNIEASGMGTEMGELNETGISSNQG